MNYTQTLVERFMRYVSVPSQSNDADSNVPSSRGQQVLGKLLCKELKELGIEDVQQDEHGVVTAFIKGNAPGDAIGFCSHLDTVDVGLSPLIKPQIIDYQGGDVLLNKERDISIKLEEHPELSKYVGQKIIFSDGTSVLGADNKAAMANIMTALSVLKEEGRKHPDLYIAFVPDEEVGLRGSKIMDLNRFKPDFAYTIDSCELGEIVYETFNAGSAVVQIEGVTAHPMSAKGVLVNPILVAHDLIAKFDRLQTPEHTEGKEGYIWITGCCGNARMCVVSMNIRDFDKDGYGKRKEFIAKAVEEIQKEHPRAKLKLDLIDVYENISNNVNPDDKPIARLFEAFADLGINPKIYSMRGGTDGSALSARGIVTPNYFTGAHNFHSYAEFLPIPSFEKSLEVTLKLIELSCA